MNIMLTEQQVFRDGVRQKLSVNERVDLFWGPFPFRFCLIVMFPGLEEMKEQDEGD